MPRHYGQLTTWRSADVPLTRDQFTIGRPPISTILEEHRDRETHCHHTLSDARCTDAPCLSGTGTASTIPLASWQERGEALAGFSVYGNRPAPTSRASRATRLDSSPQFRPRTRRVKLWNSSSDIPTLPSSGDGTRLRLVDGCRLILRSLYQPVDQRAGTEQSGQQDDQRTKTGNQTDELQQEDAGSRRKQR